MIKFSRLTDYAVVILAVLSKSDQRLMSSALLARESNLPEPTVSKVLKMLARSQLMGSVRGAQGGYELLRPADDISIIDIVTAIEGPVALTACVEGSKDKCAITGMCPVSGRWNQVNRAVKEALEDISLSDMVRDDYKLGFVPKKSTQNKNESVRA